MIIVATKDLATIAARILAIRGHLAGPSEPSRG